MSTAVEHTSVILSEAEESPWLSLPGREILRLRCTLRHSAPFYLAAFRFAQDDRHIDIFIVNIGIIGQACIDEIVSATGEVRNRSLGGVLYSYAALEKLARDTETTIQPLGYVSIPDQGYLDPLLTQLHHFDFKALRLTDDLTNRVQLVYHTDSDRTEHCPTILPTISIETLDKDRFSDLDALFVNMISGFDITLEAMEQIAKWSDEFGFHIHLDIHALALGPLSQGEGDFGHGRRARGVKDWKRWIASAHTIQLNELEADHIGEPEHVGQEALIREIIRMKNAGELEGLRAVILTRAAKGAKIHDLVSGDVTNIPAPRVEVVDSTGSGDVFGAAFIFHLSNGSSVVKATELAIEMATWNTELASIGEILE